MERTLRAIHDALRRGCIIEFTLRELPFIRFVLKEVDGEIRIREFDDFDGTMSETGADTETILKLLRRGWVPRYALLDAWEGQ
jgi:hypothetical protein